MSGELPEGWVVAKVKEVGEVQLGRQRSPKYHSGENMRPYLRVANVFEDRIDIGDVMEMDFNESDFETFRLNHGDILLNEGQSRELVGRPAMYRGEVDNCCFTNSLVRFSAGPATSSEFSLRLFLHYLKSGDFMAVSKWTTNIAHLGAGRFAEMDFPLPPLNEQKRIVAKIDALTEKSREAREALDAVPALLDQLRQSILAAAFRGDLTKKWREQNPNVEPASALLERIRTERRRKWEEAELAKFRAKGKVPPDDKWKSKYVEPDPVDTEGLPELPEGWCWAKWGEIGDSQNGRPFPSKEYLTTGTKLLRPGNLNKNGWVEWTESNTRCMPSEYEEANPNHIIGGGELVMNLTAQSLKDQFLGRVCLTRMGEHCLLNQRLARLTPTWVPPEFVFWWMKSPQFRRFVDSLNTGTLIQHMFTSQLDEHVMPVPPRPEQIEMVRIVRLMLDRLSPPERLHEDATERLNGLDSSILAKAFRGELVPQDPNDEPASVLLERIRKEREGGAPNKRSRAKS